MLVDDGTVVPSEDDVELARLASRQLSRRKREQLTVGLEDGSELVLPKAAALLLTHLLTEMSQGNAITLIPLHAELSTKQAADYLNVSRPFLVKLLEDGKIPFRKVGSHRRVLFTDLKTYKERFEAERQKVMAELAAQAEELDLGY